MADHSIHRLGVVLLAPMFAPLLLAQHAVVATTPDLASLCRSIGGESVAVTALVRGPEDPHFIDARPSMLRFCRDAEALVEVGRELEIGWLPVLVDNARNGAILGGQKGRIVASEAVRALRVPATIVDRSHGDVHALGNPHYLTDPLCGLQVAALLRDRFATMWPADRDRFVQNFAAFRQRLATAMVGSEVAAAYDHDAERLALAFQGGRLDALLRDHGDLDKLGGWFASMAPWRGGKVVADHDLWPYFAERFGIDVVAFLEPKPGVAPTSAHLERVVDTMRRDGVRVVLTSPYFPPRHAEVVARATGARIAAMLHQVGAAEGVDDYVALIDHDVRVVAAAFQAAAGK